MRQHFPSTVRVRGLCAELGEDDGLDPRQLSRRQGRRGRARRAGPSPDLRPVDRKACQLCRQVAETLDEVLAECGDSVLQNLSVTGVEPFPDASRLLVTVRSLDGRAGTALGPEAVLDHLQHASGHLRCEVAASVSRKRAPLLVYRLADPFGES